MSAINFHSRLHFPIWKRISSLPRIFVSRWQLFELQRAVKEAYEYVPMYRVLMDEVGVVPSDIQSLADIVRLPITSKRIFRTFPLEQTYRTDFVRRNEYIWNQTSGTTGIPFKYLMSSFYIHYQNKKYLRYSEYSKYRFLEWEGLSQSFINYYMPVAEFAVWYPRPHLSYFPIEDVLQKPDEVLRELELKKPYLLETLPTTGVEIARVYAESKRSYKISIPFICTHGEHLTKADRLLLGDVFNAKVYSRYGVGETGVIGVECKAHCGYHIHEESYVVEILDTNNNPVQSGMKGRVVITFFYNDVMPFLRYDTGDQGYILNEMCICGLHSQRIHVEGRLSETTMLNGKNVGIVEFEMILSEFSDFIYRFQISKVANNSIVISIIPTDHFSLSVSQRLQHEMEKMTGIRPQVNLVKEIPVSQSGKTKIFIDET